MNMDINFMSGRYRCLMYSPRALLYLARGAPSASSRHHAMVAAQGPLGLRSSLRVSPLHHGGRFSTTSATSASNNNAEATSETIDPPGGRVIETELRLEAEQSYMAYAMSVIVGRALPDVRDGLKPVQRRILYAMHELGLAHNKPFRKCARVVGEVLGKYHPHGDSSVYEAMVRMAQDFSLRAPLIDGHGNFGSVDDDPPAAMRYTECRLQGFTSAMLLSDLAADTVDYTQNFDASQEEPSVMPARIPHVLVNGSAGIAVGIATKIPPHNMRELVAGLKALIHDPDITVKQLMKHIPAPDFPTGGEVLVGEGVRDAYDKGRGSMTVRGKVHVEEASLPQGGTTDGKKKGKARSGSNKDLVVITELPYQVYKASLVEHIAELVESGSIVGVSDVRDESDRTGMRIVVELKKGSNPQLIINNLYKHTQLQMRFSANMVALVDGIPKNLTLKEFLQHFLEFRCEVVTRRARFDLERSTKRLHLVDGFLTAINQMDEVVKTIRSCKDTSSASSALQDRFGLSTEQASGVLNMSLGRLTSLEEGKLVEEKNKLTETCTSLERLLGDKAEILSVVEREAQECVDKFGSPRRSLLITDDLGDLSDTDIIPNDPCVITFSKKGYIKRMPADTFTVQNRGGRGKTGARLKADDSMDVVVSASAHDNILFFTEDGNARSLQAFQIPQVSRTSQGTAIGQVLPGSRASSIAAIMAVSEFKEEDYLIMLTEGGLIKKTSLSQFEALRSTGLTAMKLKAGDRLRWVSSCTSGCEVLIGSSCGTAIRFTTDDMQLRPLSRTAAGVVAIKLKPHCRIVGMTVLPFHVDGSAGQGPWVLLVTANGLAKRVAMGDFKCQARAGAGVIALKLNPKDSLASLQVAGLEGGVGEEVLTCTAAGVMCRTALSNVSVFSRSARGNRLLKLQEGDEVQAVTLIQTMPENAALSSDDEAAAAVG